MTTNDQNLAQPTSHLFTIRIWREDVRDGQRQVRIQIKHVLSGETRYFCEWAPAVAFMSAKLQESEAG